MVGVITVQSEGGGRWRHGEECERRNGGQGQGEGLKSGRAGVVLGRVVWVVRRRGVGDKGSRREFEVGESGGGWWGWWRGFGVVLHLLKSTVQTRGEWWVVCEVRCKGRRVM